MAKVIGIDLGTTNSVMAVMLGSDPVIIPSAEGERLTPSVVAVNKHGERLAGRPARNQAIINAANTIASFKRLMGRKYKDTIVQQHMEKIPYTLRSAKNGDVHILLAERTYAPPEVAALILAKLKADAETYLGEEIHQAVITVPAYFDDAQRNATKDAGKIAGLEVLRIINEPTASALAYGLEKTKSERIAVYDLGGGTFDVSILRAGNGVFEVKATSGDTFLGGDDFDQRIIDHLLAEFQMEHGIDLSHDPQALQRLKDAAEHAKIELSTTLQTEINLPYLAADAIGPKHLVQTLSRAKLEQLTADLVQATLQPLQRALQDANLSPDKISQVVMVGGMTRMPAIREAVRAFFGKDPHIGINPDEVVALGAAIQAGVLNGEVRDILLLDVTPLSLCIETLGGVAAPIIPRNTTVPTRKTKTFSTASDNQPSVEVHICQGERPLAEDNKSLGRFLLSGIQPAPRGVPQIEVTFDIDVNGIIKVSARDSATGNSEQLTIQVPSGLEQDEVERMRREAEQFAQEDQQKRALAALRNQADSAIYAAAKTIQVTNPSAPQRREAEEALALARRSLQSTNPQEIQAALQQMQTCLLNLLNTPDASNAETRILPDLPPLSSENDKL